MTWQSPSQLAGSSVPSTLTVPGPGNGYGPGSLSSAYWLNVTGTFGLGRRHDVDRDAEAGAEVGVDVHGAEQRVDPLPSRWR